MQSSFAISEVSKDIIDARLVIDLISFDQPVLSRVRVVIFSVVLD